jgi:hypothetical protein
MRCRSVARVASLDIALDINGHQSQGAHKQKRDESNQILKALSAHKIQLYNDLAEGQISPN